MSAQLAKDPQVVILEGNIGAGKSTFLRMVAERLKIQPVLEPHEKWQDIGGDNLLDRFYKDPQRWAYTFQSYAFISRIFEQREHSNVCADDFQILERSVYSDRYCFAKNCAENGVMTQLEWQLYKDLFGWFVDELTVFPAGFIYLRTDPETCHSRMTKRSRTEESEVALDYIRQIHDRLEEWIVQKQEVSERLAKVPVLVLDVNRDFEDDPEFAKELIDKVDAFLCEIGQKKKPHLAAEFAQGLYKVGASGYTQKEI
jgi:deoxyadenosine/deoxycytidine kinase